MPFILPIKSLLQVLWSAGTRLAVAETADELRQRMNENGRDVYARASHALNNPPDSIQHALNPYESRSIQEPLGVTP